MKKYNRFFLVCGLAMACSEIWKQLSLTYIVNNGHYIWWYFPFQLCSIPMYICLILPWIKSGNLRGILLSFLKDFGMLAGIFTFFDTSGLHYSYFPLTVHSFVWHLLLIILGVAAGCSGESSTGLKEFGKCLLLFAGLCIMATGFNLLLDGYGDINMFYINPHYSTTQKVFRDITAVVGNTAGILIYILSVAFGAGIFHIVWSRILSRLQKRKDNEE